MLQSAGGGFTEPEPATRGRARLDPLLRGIDRRLQLWAHWARDYYLARGVPVATDQVATDSSPAVPWPAHVRKTHEAVQRLHWQLTAGLMAHYMNSTAAERLAAYAQLVKYFGAQHPATDRRDTRSVGADALLRNTDRARWTLRHAMLDT
jgi:hypothetical protein